MVANQQDQTTPQIIAWERPQLSHQISQRGIHDDENNDENNDKHNTTSKDRGR